MHALWGDIGLCPKSEQGVGALSGQPSLWSSALLQDGSPGVTVDPRGTTTPLIHATFSGACRRTQTTFR